MTNDPVPISALEHYCYCPRQAAMILVDGDWVDNRATTKGHLGHRRADSPGAKVGRGRRVVRAVALWSQHWGLTGRADAIEIDDMGLVIPVEYKIGFQHGDAAHVQVCAQAFCIEEMTGQAVSHGAIWFAGPRRRVTFELDEDLRRRTADVIAAVRRLRDESRLPEPANDTRCDSCQLWARCLPHIVAERERVDRYLDQVVFECRS